MRYLRLQQKYDLPLEAQLLQQVLPQVMQQVIADAQLPGPVVQPYMAKITQSLTARLAHALVAQRQAMQVALFTRETSPLFMQIAGVDPNAAQHAVKPAPVPPVSAMNPHGAQPQGAPVPPPSNFGPPIPPPNVVTLTPSQVAAAPESMLENID
jgi:hypothetical protein